jgi:hypothetical protein
MMAKFKVIHTIIENTKNRKLEDDNVSIIEAENVGEAIQLVRVALELSLTDQDVQIAVRAIPYE